MDLVPVEALMRVKQEFGLTWITAHLADLLHHAGKVCVHTACDTMLN